MSAEPAVRAPAVRADVITPPPASEAFPKVLASAARTPSLLLRRRLHHPTAWKGVRITFADGTASRVYRESRVGDGRAEDPALLVVGFVLRHVHGRMPHATFRVESWLNTPMFVGFPGFTSKLWMADDEHGVYRGFYEWDGADCAADYVHALSWVLGLVSVPGSIRAHIVPGRHRDEAMEQPQLLGTAGEGSPEWWRPVRHDP